MSKVSAIDAIIQPFPIQSKSTQTLSPVSKIRLGGKEVTVFDLATQKNITRSEGGEVVAVQHRIRTGKTKKEKSRGHVAGKKNRRIWVDDKTTNSGRWTKV